MNNEATIKLPPEAAPAFLLAGKALFTVVSKKTGAHFTYKLEEPKEARKPGQKPLFARVLVGGDSYKFVGTFWRDHMTFKPNPKMPPEVAEHPRVQALEYLFRKLEQGDLSSMEIMHHGRCGRCGRVLTHPESIERGIGPECMKAGM